MSRNIKIIAIGLSILGLLAEMMSLFIHNLNDYGQILFTIRGFLNSLNLQFFSLNIFEYRDFGQVIGLNYINVAFYLLLLVGAIAYSASKEKETRLLRFVFSVLLISNILFIVWSLLYPIVFMDYIKGQYYWLISWVFNLAKNVGVAYLAYYALSNLNRTKELDVTLRETDSQPSICLSNEASRWQRFAHLLLDIYICLFIFSPFASIFGASILEPLASIFGERFAIYIYYFAASLVYFPLFEIFFGATPAKFLTETRVVDVYGHKPKVKTILGRTLARHIPFEAFSFLGAQGWHDGISKTQVVREVRSGVKGRWYLLIIPSFILLSLAIYWGHVEYKHYQSYLYSKARHEENISSIRSSIQNLTTSDAIEIEDVAYRYSSDRIFLKVEYKEKDEIMAAVVIIKEDYSNSLLSVELAYKERRDQLSLIPIKISDLHRAYTPDYDQSKTESMNTVEFLNDGRKFEIKRVERLFGPSIHDRNTGSYGENITIELCNYGWPAQITAIQTLEGGIKWTDELPKPVPTVTGSDYPSFSIHGSEYKAGEKYKFKMTVVDSLNRKQTYLIEGHDLQKTIQLLK